MCQIISFVINNDNDRMQEYIEEQYEAIKTSLLKKGGESFSFFAVNDVCPQNYILEYCNDIEQYDNTFEKFFNRLSQAGDIIEQSNGGNDKNIEVSWAFVFFSRQAPEMEIENNNTEAAPYIINNKLVWMHGTIANIPEIEEALGIKINVDTEAFAYVHELWRDHAIKLEGVYLGLVFDINDFINRITSKYSLTPTDVREYFKIYYNGIGIWMYEDNIKEGIGTWYTTDSSLNDCYGIFTKICDCESFIEYDSVNDNVMRDVFYVSYSGGMDITLSLYTFLKSNTKRVYGNLNYEQTLTYTEKEVKLIYFDYGARARKQEINALNNFHEFLKKEFPDIEFNVEIYDTRSIFTQLSKFSKYESKLMKDDSQGEEAETEANLAYVPYRNTEFGLMLGAIIDRDLELDNNIRPNILFGLNLTELGVYVDNTEAWFEFMIKAIEYGGKKYKKIESLAPFINTTKTNMIAFMIKKYGYNKTKELLNIAFSCYYPTEDGQPCGKCGSCILREKALERALYRLKKESLKDK